MKTRSKALLVSLCAVLLVAVSVIGTMAYLTSKDTVVNTFTVGSVEIELDEADVDENGSYVTTHDNRVKDNTYHLLPGHTYYKDPTVTVLKDSEESYVRMKVTVNYSTQLDAIFAPSGADLTSIFGGYDKSNWSLKKVSEDAVNNTRTYEFWYVGVEHKGMKEGTVQKAEADIALDDLFESITIPDSITKEQLATLVTKDEDGKITDQLKITVIAEAIQADGFADADAAWEAFE